MKYAFKNQTSGSCNDQVSAGSTEENRQVNS